MRQISINVYQFDELSDDAKKKALENLRHINVDGACDDWHEPLIEEFKEDLKAVGFKPDNVRFRGFWSQGDGASFTGKIVDFVEFCKKTWFRFSKNHMELMAIAAENWDIRIEREDWHYCHAYTVGAIITGYGLNTYEVRGAKELERFLNDWEVEQAGILYYKLEEEYNHLTSDAEVTETIHANEWEFLADGKLYKKGA